MSRYVGFYNIFFLVELMSQPRQLSVNCQSGRKILAPTFRLGFCFSICADVFKVVKQFCLLHLAKYSRRRAEKQRQLLSGCVDHD